MLPLLPIDQDYHPHGITISPRLYSAATKAQPSEKSNGELVLPKTFITRKGALMLFTAPNDFDELLEDDNLYLKKAHRFLRTHYAEQIAKLGNLSRLAQSILMFGDEVMCDASVFHVCALIHIPYILVLCIRRGHYISQYRGKLGYKTKQNFKLLKDVIFRKVAFPF